MTGETKKWGKGEFWGLGSDYDQDWILTEEQKSLRTKLMEVCRTKIRPHAIHCDKTYEFPRKSLNVMAELGLLGLIVPKELGGLGQNHVGASMIVETLARYGCLSTALVYTMHVAACAAMLHNYHDNHLHRDILSRLDKDKLIGTLAYSDPATGSHFWNPLSSKVKNIDENTLQILKYCSWVTSAGFADWYLVETLAPEFNGNCSNLSVFLFYNHEVRASSEDWSAMGMHGNQSGPLIIEGKFNMDRLVCPHGKGRELNGELVTYFNLLASASYNGISLACMDVAKKHVTRKAHADAGMRICDYPSIQDYFGECVSSTSICRSHVLFIAQVMDKDTNNNNWSVKSDANPFPRSKYTSWLWIAKYRSTKNANEVSNAMLHACGGSGYKTEMGLERLFRDAQAGWVMAPTNEVLKQYIGKSSLLGFDSLDFWELKSNERVLQHEVEKLGLDAKKALAKKLLDDIDLEESGGQPGNKIQDTDFENPFNTSEPAYLKQILTTRGGSTHAPSLNPKLFQPLKLVAKNEHGNNIMKFVFNLKNPTDHTGCLAGQYVQIRVQIDGRYHERHFSPVSRPDDFGKIELILKLETHGIMSQFLKWIKLGEQVDFKGPCGGFEYEANKLNELTFLASGGGVTPALQLIRCIMDDPTDKTRVNLIYYADTYDDILLREELDNYAVGNSRLRVLYTLGESPEDWEGEEGFISTELIDKNVTKPNGDIHKILMCGGTTMTISCLYSLRSLEYPSDMIFIYGALGVELVRKVYGRNVRLSGHKCSFDAY